MLPFPTSSRRRSLTASLRRAAVVALGLVAFLEARSQPPEAPAAAPAIPADALSRETPRRAARAFVAAVEARDYTLAAEYLDLRDLPPRYRGVPAEDLARQLAIVFSREVWINAAELSDAPEGAVADGLPPEQDRIATIRSDSGDVVLLLQRMEHEDGARVWKISNSTVARTAELYAEFGYGPVVELVAGGLPDVSFLGVELFKWVFVLAVGAIAYALLAAAAWFLALASAGRGALTRERLWRYLRGPVAGVITVLIMNAVLYNLGLGGRARSIAAGHTVVIIAVTWAIIATLDVVRDGYIASLRQQRRDAAVVIQRPLFAVFKIMVLIAATVTWLDNIGYDVTTLVASLGIGGIAVALALQRPLEDVIGAFTLYNQQPIRIGDLCRFGDKLGIIEQIGLRTTRIRTLANTMISVPNSKIAGEYLENLSARSKILYNPTLRLRYDTAPDALHRVLDGLRAMLANHAKIGPDAYVRFVQIGADALVVEVFAYVVTTEWPEYLEIAEDVNFRVLGVVSAARASLALPAQNLVVDVGRKTSGSDNPESGKIRATG